MYSDVMQVDAWVPLLTPTANKLLRLHWRVRAGANAKTRKAVAAVLGQSDPPRAALLRVTLVRCSRGAAEQDDDNLQASLKSARDEVAKWLGRDDASPSIEWRYAQRRRCSHGGVRIVVTSRDAPAVELPEEPAPKPKETAEQRAARLERRRQRDALVDAIAPSCPVLGETLRDPGIFALDERTGRGDLAFRFDRPPHSELVAVVRPYDGGGDLSRARTYVSLHVRWDVRGQRARTRGVGIERPELRPLAAALLQVADALDEANEPTVQAAE